MTGVAVVGRRFGCRVQVPALRGRGVRRRRARGSRPRADAYKASKLGIPHVCGSLGGGPRAPRRRRGHDRHAPAHALRARARRGRSRTPRALREAVHDRRRGGRGSSSTRPSAPGVVGALGHEFRWNPARAAIGAAIASRARSANRGSRRSSSTRPSCSTPTTSLAMPSWFEEPGIGGLARSQRIAHPRPAARSGWVRSAR